MFLAINIFINHWQHDKTSHMSIILKCMFIGQTVVCTTVQKFSLYYVTLYLSLNPFTARRLWEQSLAIQQLPLDKSPYVLPVL